MEFLVQMTAGLLSPNPETDRLREAEARRAAELAHEGMLIRLWRIPGSTANWGLWRAPDATALHEALMSLPLAGYSSFDVRALAQHPNDPEATEL